MNSTRKNKAERTPQVDDDNNSLNCTSIEPTKDDVLLGRATTVYNHPGNRRYRQIISQNLRRYKQAKTRLDKMVLIREITEQILDDGKVRFLRRESKSGNWCQVPFRIAQDKVSHALRDGITKPTIPISEKVKDFDMESLHSNKTPLNPLLAVDSVETSLQDWKQNYRELLQRTEQQVHIQTHAQSKATLLRHSSQALHQHHTSVMAPMHLPSSQPIPQIPTNSHLTININARPANPIIRLEGMAAATANSRAALARLNALSAISHGNIQTIGTQPFLNHHPSQIHPLQSHNRLLPPLITAPEIPRDSSMSLSSRPSPLNWTSLSNHNIDALLGGVVHENARLPLVPQPQKIFSRSTALEEALAHRENTQLHSLPPPAALATAPLPSASTNLEIQMPKITVEQPSVAKADDEPATSTKSRTTTPKSFQSCASMSATKNFIHQVVRKYTANCQPVSHPIDSSSVPLTLTLTLTSTSKPKSPDAQDSDGTVAPHPTTDTA